jgi:hypothetical protein
MKVDRWMPQPVMGGVKFHVEILTGFVLVLQKYRTQRINASAFLPFDSIISDMDSNKQYTKITNF